MPRIIETVVYTIDELSDDAKEAARCWYRQQGLHDEWYDFVYEDFGTICRILGVTLRTTPMKIMGGGTRDKPHLMFRGFSSQRARETARRSKASGVMPADRARPSAPRRPATRNCAASRTSCSTSNGANFSSCTRPSGRAASIAMNTP